jgi:hypothetical protein
VARVLEVVHAVSSGTYNQDGVNVTYRQGSKTLHELMPSVITGTVSPTAPRLVIPRFDRRCLTRVRPLTDGPA